MQVGLEKAVEKCKDLASLTHTSSKAERLLEKEFSIRFKRVPKTQKNQTANSSSFNTCER